MLNEFTVLRIKGANFTSETELPILSSDKGVAKATILYGRNGSGKSTIAKAFRKLQGCEEQSIIKSEILDCTGALITPTEFERNHIFVFDEDFVNENVRIPDSGLESIVMLGEQVGLSDLIDTTATELHIAEIDRDQKKIVADEYKDLSNDKSPKFYIEKMKSVLRGDNNWAGRDKKIKGNVANSPVSDDTCFNLS